ncbi:gametogenetin-binding protein 2, partial [Hippocampus comes]|uniref:gametogenetin-binding protein 2 n=1 Tax=Hippocampus comes TaxID=109280 RepID=UPI00094E1C60
RLCIYLFYLNRSKLNDVIDAIPKSKKSTRCQLHSLDTNKLRPARASWMDVWERMSQECRAEVLLVDCACLLETLDTHLQKHGLCTDCKTKVMRAYDILIGEVDSSEEKDYCAALYEGLCCCPCEHHIQVCYETDFIARLLSRAEPEFVGASERRHAKTIDTAQEEVLTCLGIHLSERLHKIWQKLRAEEQTWQILFHVGIDELRKSFEMAVEKIQGISRLEQLVEELSEKERAKQLKQEKKRQKRKNRRRNRCGLDILDQEAEIKEKDLDEGSLESEDGTCPACDEGEKIPSIACKSFSCSDKQGQHPHKTTTNHPKLTLTSKGGKQVCILHPFSISAGSDCGYSSSIEGSQGGSREGSDVACSEGLCNHEEAGESNEHDCAEDKKEEEATDSCVDCWPHSEDNKPQCKGKKKKRKGSGLRHKQGHTYERHTVPPSNVSQTKDLNSSLCGEKMACFAQQLPWACGKNLSLDSRPLEANKSLADLLDDSEVTSDEEHCLTQDEIQAFLERNSLFYRNRHKYRQLLKDKFTNYCCASDRKTACCHHRCELSAQMIPQGKSL